jgi:peptidoglycan glycosyltransferase
VQQQIRRVGFGLLFAFLAVFVMLNYVQFFAAESIASRNENVRSLIAEYSIKRGDITTLDGVVVAESKDTGGRFRFRRTYPQPELYAHITGFYSIVFGTAGVEAAYDDELLGESGVVSMQDIEDRFLGEGEQGDDVTLNIDSRLQELARDTLGEQQGAVVALDPQSGEVRAMWSNPSYDPNPLASFESQESKQFRNSLDPNSPTSPLVSKVTLRGYPPGSTFKVVTAAAALESGRFRPSSTFPDPEALDLPLTDDTLQNFTKTVCESGGTISLARALVISCDTTFAMLGLQIPDELKSTAEDFGFNDIIPFDLVTGESAFPEVPDDEEPVRAFAGIGQGDVVATPLQMALVAAAVANGGDVPRPRLVREVTDASGGIVERFSPETIGTAMSSNTASELRNLMVDVVQEGTGTAAQIPDIAVAGKTGTAQSVEGAAPHAWFICFAPADDPQLAVAVIVENGGSLGSEATGGEVAAPIAKAILERDRELREW